MFFKHPKNLQRWQERKYAYSQVSYQRRDDLEGANSVIGI